MSWQLALSEPASTDWSGFSRLLNDLGIAHRISEARGTLQLWVIDEATAEQVQLLYRAFMQQPVDNLEFVERADPAPATVISIRKRLLLYPLTSLVLLLTLLAAIWTGVGTELDNAAWLTFNALLSDDQGYWFAPLADSLANGQWWRLITPVFLHFGWLHLAMNSMWFWELGRRIEQLQGSLFLLGFVLLSALASNFSQFWFSGPSFFGGLSGVLYALLGFCWIHQRLAPSGALDLPRGVVGMMLVWLLLCLSGVITALGFGQIANAAHVSGLVIGCVAGLSSGLWKRSKGRSECA